MDLSTLRRSCLWLLLALSSCSTTDLTSNPPANPDGATTEPDGGAPQPDTGANPDGNGDDATVDERCGQYAALECNRNRDCFSVYLDWTYGSYDACLAQSKEVCLVWSSMPGSSVTAANLLGCERAYEAAGCAAQGPFPECQFVPGQLANGGPCLLNDQCGSGNCRRAVTNDCGACADKFTEGTACTKAGDCVSGRCSAGFCEPILKEGDVCANSADCLGSLICDAGVCKKVTVVGEGQDCGGTNVCGLYMTCASGRCFKDVVVDVGQSCGEMANAGFAFCRNGDCNAQSLCVNRPALGGACSSGGSCAGTAVCVQGQCRALTTSVCDGPPQEIVVRGPAAEFDRAALAGRTRRARPGQAQRPGG